MLRTGTRSLGVAQSRWLMGWAQTAPSPAATARFSPSHGCRATAARARARLGAPTSPTGPCAASRPASRTARIWRPTHAPSATAVVSPCIRCSCGPRSAARSSGRPIGCLASPRSTRRARRNGLRRSLPPTSACHALIGGRVCGRGRPDGHVQLVPRRPTGRTECRGRRPSSRASADFETVKWTILEKPKRLRTSCNGAPGGSGGSHGPGAGPF